MATPLAKLNEAALVLKDDVSAARLYDELSRKKGLKARLQRALCMTRGYMDHEEGTLAYTLFESTRLCTESVLNGYGPSPLPPDPTDYAALDETVATERADMQQRAEELRQDCLSSPDFTSLCAAAQAENVRVGIEVAVMDEGYGIEMKSLSKRVSVMVSVRVYLDQPYAASAHLQTEAPVSCAKTVRTPTVSS